MSQPVNKFNLPAGCWCAAALNKYKREQADLVQFLPNARLSKTLHKATAKPPDAVPAATPRRTDKKGKPAPAPSVPAAPGGATPAATPAASPAGTARGAAQKHEPTPASTRDGSPAPSLPTPDPNRGIMIPVPTADPVVPFVAPATGQAEWASSLYAAMASHRNTQAQETAPEMMTMARKDYQEFVKEPHEKTLGVLTYLATRGKFAYGQTQVA